MFDDRRMRQLEIQVDALRTNEKDSESRKTYDEVFDHAALLTIADLITEGVHNNVLVMEYIGDETQPAPALREVRLEDPTAVYADVVANLQAIRKAELVHADMSEYNLLWWDGRVIVIDVGQAVTLDHPRASEWFKRDVGNIARFFRRLRVNVTASSLERAILGG